MLFYSYCPECGCESDPFRIEPKDGTPMRCPRCGLEYPYKTRHWMAQRISLRIFLLALVLFWVIRGCVDGCERKRDAERRELAEKNSVGAVMSRERPDVKKGLCTGFEWGSGRRKGYKEEVKQLGARTWWDEVHLRYGGITRGLESFLLVRRNVPNGDSEKYMQGYVLPWFKGAKRSSFREFKRKSDGVTAMAVSPHGEFRAILRTEPKDNGRHHVSLEVVAERIATDYDFDAQLKAEGFVEVK